MAAKQWWLVNSKSNGWQARVQKPIADSVRVIEAEPAEAKILKLEAKVKELKGLIDAIYAAQNG